MNKNAIFFPATLVHALKGIGNSHLNLSMEEYGMKYIHR